MLYLNFSVPPPDLEKLNGASRGFACVVGFGRKNVGREIDLAPRILVSATGQANTQITNGTRNKSVQRLHLWLHRTKTFRD